MKTDSELLNWLAIHPRAATIIVNGVSTECLFYGISLAPGIDLRTGLEQIIDAHENLRT